MSMMAAMGRSIRGWIPILRLPHSIFPGEGTGEYRKSVLSSWTRLYCRSGVRTVIIASVMTIRLAGSWGRAPFSLRHRFRWESGPLRIVPGSPLLLAGLIWMDPCACGQPDSVPPAPWIHSPIPAPPEIRFYGREHVKKWKWSRDAEDWRLAKERVFDFFQPWSGDTRFAFCLSRTRFEYHDRSVDPASWYHEEILHNVHGHDPGYQDSFQIQVNGTDYDDNRRGLVRQPDSGLIPRPHGKSLLVGEREWEEKDHRHWRKDVLHVAVKARHDQGNKPFRIYLDLYELTPSGSYSGKIYWRDVSVVLEPGEVEYLEVVPPYGMMCDVRILGIICGGPLRGIHWEREGIDIDRIQASHAGKISGRDAYIRGFYSGMALMGFLGLCYLGYRGILWSCRR